MSKKSTVSQRITKLINNIASDFSLEKLSKSPARFDTQKLAWFNRQYIQMMSLDEFTIRAFELKLSQKSKQTKLRVGDYVYLVDLEKQKTFVEVFEIENFGVDGGIYHQMGGGRENTESSIVSLMREVQEESDGKLKLDPEKLIKLASYEILFDQLHNIENPDTKTQESYDGKEHNVYVYFIDQHHLLDFVNQEQETYEWRDLVSVLSRNRYITYPVWKAFCKQNSIQLVEPNHAILRQYLAWQLDKNRVSLLGEIGNESNCILDWKQPSVEDVSWKKISREESLANLKEIQKVIENFYNDNTLNIKAKQDDLYNKVKNEIYVETEKEIDHTLTDLTNTWETLLKNWITDNNKDAGSFFWPLRVALSGKQKSPSPFEILAILSLEEVNIRLDKVTI